MQSSFRTCILLVLYLFVLASAEKQVEIGNFYVKVYLAPSTSSKFIGLAQKGEVYSILGTRDSWYRIKFKNAVGWIQESQVKPYDPDAAVTTSAEPNTDSSAPDTLISQARPDSLAQPQPQLDTNTTQAATSPSVPKQTYAPLPQRQAANQPSSPQPPQPPQPKRESRLKNWFTQQNFLHNPTADHHLEEIDIKYFQVTFGPARVLLYLSPDAPIVGMARKGDLLQLVGEGDSWCKVVYGDTIGWIERRNGKVVDAPRSFLTDEVIMVAIGVGGLGVIFLIVVIIIVISRKRRNTLKSVSVKKNVLFIAKTGKTIQYTLTDNSTTIEKCFSEIGFNIAIARDLSSLRNSLAQTQPDVVMVDWKFDRNIFASVERIFAPMPGSDKILFIVYNVPDPSIMKPSRILKKMTYLGLTFSDRDIFKLVTPLISAEANKNIQKSVQSSALEGELSNQNLMEVLQFIEIGSKTGCLLIETERPFGLVYFFNGRIIYAATAQGITGRDAVFTILTLKDGKFRFILNKKPKTSNVNLSTLEVLMEWTKAVDEATGH